MKTALALFLSILMPVLAGCQIVGDIFKAGVWVGVLMVFGVVALIVWMVSKG